MQPDAWLQPQSLYLVKVGTFDGLTVICGASVLPQGDGGEQGRALSGVWSQANLNKICRIGIDYFGGIAVGAGGHQQIFQRTAQADPEFAVTGVNGGQMASKVRVDFDHVGFDGKLPGLGVVATGGQRCIADKFAHLRRLGCWRGILRKRATGLAGLLVIIQPRRIFKKCIATDNGDTSRGQQF